MNKATKIIGASGVLASCVGCTNLETTAWITNQWPNAKLTAQSASMAVSAVLDQKTQWVIVGGKNDNWVYLVTGGNVAKWQTNGKEINGHQIHLTTGVENPTYNIRYIELEWNHQNIDSANLGTEKTSASSLRTEVNGTTTKTIKTTTDTYTTTKLHGGQTTTIGANVWIRVGENGTLITGVAHRNSNNPAIDSGVVGTVGYKHNIGKSSIQVAYSTDNYLTAGTNFAVNDNLDIQASAKHNNKTNDTVAGIGLTYRFGGSSSETINRTNSRMHDLVGEYGPTSTNYLTNPQNQVKEIQNIKQLEQTIVTIHSEDKNKDKQEEKPTKPTETPKTPKLTTEKTNEDKTEVIPFTTKIILTDDLAEWVEIIETQWQNWSKTITTEKITIKNEKWEIVETKLGNTTETINTNPTTQIVKKWTYNINNDEVLNRFEREELNKTAEQVWKEDEFDITIPQWYEILQIWNTDENGNRIGRNNWWVNGIYNRPSIIEISDYNDVIRYWIVKIKHTKTGMERELKVKYDFTLLP